MKSMTGYGKAIGELPQKKVTVEMRSLNSKQLDLNFRIFPGYRNQEAELRGEMARHCERGKLDFSIYVEHTGESGLVSVNMPMALNYKKALQELSKEINEEPKEGYLSLIVKMPDVMKQERQEVGEDEWKSVRKIIKEALAAFNKFREDEGRVLQAEFTERINIIREKLEAVIAQDPQRISGIRDRITKNLDEFIGSEKIDRNRFEQELIYYLEKLDITEEKLRLKTHCEYFLNTMNENSSGRKLGFIAQEIGREINTIGSKSNDADIQRQVVEMKDELEKIKEQLLNVL